MDMKIVFYVNAGVTMYIDSMQTGCLKQGSGAQPHCSPGFLESMEAMPPLLEEFGKESPHALTPMSYFNPDSSIQGFHGVRTAETSIFQQIVFKMVQE